jgi:hypothetical protein
MILHRWAIVLGCALAISTQLVSNAIAFEREYFAEHFESDAANWGENSFPNLLTHVTGGGPDGAGDNYASSARSFDSLSGIMGSYIVFRGQANLNSSNGDYIGDWVADQVVRVEAMVRHDFSQPISLGGRFASPMNSPGASFIGAEVEPNTWTPLTFFIDPDNVFDPITNPTGQTVTFGGGSFETVFDEIGNFQISLTEPMGLSDTERQQVINFDLDAVTITAVPEPASVVMLTIATIATLGFVSRHKRG